MEWSFRKIKQHQHICPRQLKYLHYALRSEGEALPWALSHHSCGGRRLCRSGGGRHLAGARPLARATSCWRDGETAEQHVHGGEQGLKEADGAEGGAPVGGEVDLVGVWAGGDEGWLQMVLSAATR